MPLGTSDSRLVRDPVYQQLNDRLRDLIRCKEFRPGDRFLTERQIAERFGVSRPTANKALASLVSEGILEFRKGVGTFVREEVLDYDLRYLVSFTQQAQAQGKRPRTKVLTFRTLSLREIEDTPRAALRLTDDAVVIYLERVRLADDLPVIYERRHVDSRHCPGLSRADVTGSLYSVWTEKYGLSLVGADETIRAVNLTDDQAKLLQVPPGSAALLVESTGFIAGEVPLWWEQTLYRADAYVFRNRLGGLVGKPALRQLL
ncbi:MAG: GntR family transcriptional regulator [Gemmataceae bacterium]|nr:GntR family transcriptional regulator [Gemmataceae bacterium]MDW8266111.1 GntR family transcriptional regulator [Gemmataceae bacterium]